MAVFLLHIFTVSTVTRETLANICTCFCDPERSPCSPQPGRPNKSSTSSDKELNREPPPKGAEPALFDWVTKVFGSEVALYTLEDAGRLATWLDPQLCESSALEPGSIDSGSVSNIPACGRLLLFNC